MKTFHKFVYLRSTHSSIICMLQRFIHFLYMYVYIYVIVFYSVYILSLSLQLNVLCIHLWNFPILMRWFKGRREISHQFVVQQIFGWYNLMCSCLPTTISMLLLSLNWIEQHIVHRVACIFSKIYRYRK